MKTTKGRAPRQFQNRQSLRHSDIALDSVLTLGDYKILTNEAVRRLKVYIDDQVYAQEQYERECKWYRRLARWVRREPMHLVLPDEPTTNGIEDQLNDTTD